MIYLFKINETMKAILPLSKVISWTLIEEVGAFERCLLELPIDQELKNVHYFGFTHDMRFRLFKVERRKIDRTILFEGVDKAYYDLKYHSIIEDLRPTGSFSYVIGKALERTGYRVFDSNVSDKNQLRLSFYRISPLEAMAKTLTAFGYEFQTGYYLNNSQITQRGLWFRKRFGSRLPRVFAYGKDVLSLVIEDDRSELVGELAGYGRGEEKEDTGGYGRRIQFKDISWSRAKGDPVDKPLGVNKLRSIDYRPVNQIYHNGESRVSIDTFIAEDAETPEELILRTWEELQRRQLPKVKVTAKIVDVDDSVKIGDEVMIVRDDIGVSFWARIVKKSINLIAGGVASVELDVSDAESFYKNLWDFR